MEAFEVKKIKYIYRIIFIFSTFPVQVTVDEMIEHNNIDL
jgi:hypothetical protein